jgi:hypothetical protein
MKRIINKDVPFFKPRTWLIRKLAGGITVVINAHIDIEKGLIITGKTGAVVDTVEITGTGLGAAVTMLEVEGER